MLNAEQPEEAAEIFSSTGVEARAKKVGDLVADITVSDSAGRSVRLSQTWRRGPLVIIFFRGGQRMRCDQELQAWRRHLRQLTALGASIVAISPLSTAEYAEEFATASSDIPIFSDARREAANAFELSVTLPPEVVDLYAASGLDAPVLSADGSWLLPIPATFVVDRNGRVCYAHVDADAEHHVEPGVVLTALAQLSRARLGRRASTSRLARLLWPFEAPSCMGD